MVQGLGLRSDCFSSLRSCARAETGTGPGTGTETAHLEEEDDGWDEGIGVMACLMSRETSAREVVRDSNLHRWDLWNGVKSLEG